MNRKLLRVSLFIATIAVALFARAVEMFYAQWAAPIQVPLHFDKRTGAQVSFVADKETTYFVKVVFRRGIAAEQAAEIRPAVEWNVTSTDKTPIRRSQRDTHYWGHSGYEVGQFEGEPGKRYTVAVRAKRFVTEMQTLDPQVRIIVSPEAHLDDNQASAVLGFVAITLFVISLACLGDGLRSYPKPPRHQ